MSEPEENIQIKLGVSFKNPEMLHKALIHRSYLNEAKNELESNERLEFLGDAVLEFIVSSIIYAQFPEMDEGKLTALRSKLVNTVSLSEVATDLNLGEYLHLSKGEEEGGGRHNPSLLADTFEALIGALYLDLGIEASRKVVEKLIVPKAKTAINQLKDAKSLLQEKVQAKNNPAPVYKVISQVGPDHARIFTVGVFVNSSQLALGRGKSKQTAEQEAAENALATLQ